MPLLMLHGLGCASSFEYPHVARAPALAERHIILLDLFGFGYSDQPTDFGYRVTDHANTVAEFVGLMQLGRIDLYGHSMGGTVAIEVATLLGKDIVNLVLSEANLDSGGGQFSKAIALASEEDYVEETHAEIVAAAQSSGNTDWATTMRASDPRAVYWGARSLVDGGTTSWRSQLYDQPSSKSFIFGERSLPDPDFAILQAAGIQTLSVPEAGHSMGLENPIGLAECINEAIKIS